MTNCKMEVCFFVFVRFLSGKRLVERHGFIEEVIYLEGFYAPEVECHL